MSNVELFPHNEEAYLDMLEGLTFSNFAFMERATGTGKSMVLIKLMDELMRNKRILFVTLHDSMFKQFLDRDMKTLGVSKDEFDKLDCILYSSINKHTADWYLNNYDYFIFDEAQHCGADKWGKVIGEISEMVANSDDKKMLGATATRTRYLDNYLDVCSEYFDDNLCSSLYLSEAILRELLPAPYYVNLNSVSLDNVLRIRNKLHKLNMYHELDIFREEVESIYKDIKSKIQINDLLEKYDLKCGEKYIVFCSNVDDLTVKMNDSDNWFNNIGKVKKYYVHSKKSNDFNLKQIKEFENDDDNDSIKVMFAVDMFNEGLHIKDIDGIIMTRKTASPIVYLQQLGRALSYSSRKKQIKIFDIAGNAVNIDVIYNIYKELLDISRDRLSKGIGNIELYKDIISRFKIVDEGVVSTDRLSEIEKFIDDNYLNKELISKYVSILCNYTETINGKFMDLLEDKLIDREHLKIYIELQKLVNYISYSDLMKLSSYGILVSDIQLDNDLLEKIKEKGNYKTVIDDTIKQFMISYNLFYSNNGRRPDKDREDEKELYNQYRYYLSNLRKSEIKKYLKNSTYSLNVEELLLINNFPSREDMYSYLDIIEYKYLNGVSLDELEIITVKNIFKTININDRPIIKSIVSNNLVMIDDAIRTLSDYKKIYPDEDFSSLIKFSNNVKIYTSIQLIHSKALLINNLQFQKLLSLGIKLPKEIDMTLEERLSRLGNFQSFHDLIEYNNSVDTNEIIDFIVRNNRRPDINNQFEKRLSDNIDRLCKDKKSIWSKKIFKCIEDNNLDISIIEKFSFYPDSLKKSDYKELFDTVYDELKNIDIDKFNSTLIRNRVKLLYKNGYITSRLKDILLTTTSLVQFVIDNKDRDKISGYLVNKQGYIPYSLKEFLNSKYNLNYSVLDKNVNYRTNFINYAHGEYNALMRGLDDYYDYIKKNNTRPQTFTVLHSKLRDYYSNSSPGDILKVVNRINKLGCSITLYEKYLIGLCNEDEERRLYDYLKNKRLKRTNYDALDEKVYFKLFSKLEYGINDVNEANKDNKSINDNIKNDLIMRTKEKIDLDPSIKIDYSTGEFSKEDIKELEQYRIIKYSSVFLINLINKMKRENSIYQDILSDSDIELLKKIINISKRNKTNLDIIYTFNELQRKLYLKKYDIDINVFLYEYVDYVKNNGFKPSKDSPDDLGRILFNKFELIKGILTTDEIKKIDSDSNKILSKMIYDDLYERFISFIHTNCRFPSVLSEDSTEVMLAKEYQAKGTKFNSIQRNEISLLRKKYGLNTIMFGKKRG